MLIHVSSIIATIILFIISWVIVSIPVWLAAKVVSRNGTFGRAMAATLLATIVFVIVVAVFGFIHFPLIGLLLGIIGVLAVFKSVFDTGWGGALAIAILAFIIYVIIAFILALIGVSLIFFKV